jgi:hypothetical protein
VISEESSQQTKSPIVGTLPATLYVFLPDYVIAVRTLMPVDWLRVRSYEGVEQGRSSRMVAPPQLLNRLATLGVQIMPRLKAMIMMYLVSVLLTFASRFWILL